MVGWGAWGCRVHSGNLPLTGSRGVLSSISQVRSSACKGLVDRGRNHAKKAFCSHPLLLSKHALPPTAAGVVLLKGKGDYVTSLLKTLCVYEPLSCGQFFATPWTVACQALLFMGFCRQEYWSGLPGPLLGDLPDPGIEPLSPVSPALQADSL